MDDLVKRLRNTPNWMREGFQDWKDNVRTYDRAPFEAADRIEELEANINIKADFIDATINQLEAAEQRGYANAMEAERKLHEDRIEELEAKLAKLRTFLDELWDSQGYNARELHDLLKELDGVSDE